MRFMRFLGMRTIFDGPAVSVHEMRGGPHLILMAKETVAEVPGGPNGLAIGPDGVTFRLWAPCLEPHGSTISTASCSSS